jgi:hypothetical protein
MSTLKRNRWGEGDKGREGKRQKSRRDIDIEMGRYRDMVEREGVEKEWDGERETGRVE